MSEVVRTGAGFKSIEFGSDRQIVGDQLLARGRQDLLTGKGCSGSEPLNPVIADLLVASAPRKALSTVKSRRVMSCIPRRHCLRLEKIL